MIGLQRVSSVSPASGVTFGGTPVTVTGLGFAGGDGYRCRFGRLGPSPWYQPNENHVLASFVDATTLRCVSPPAKLANAMKVLYESFNAAAREIATAQFAGDASLQSGEVTLCNGTAAPWGGVSFALPVAVPSFEARFNLSMAFGGYVEVLYAERPHEEQYTPCTPRCHDDPNCPPHLDCKPLLEPPTNGLRVRLDATQLPHAIQVTLNQQTVLRRALDVTLTSGTQLTAVLLAVYDGALHLTHGGRKLADGIMLPDWSNAFNASWRFGILGVATAPPNAATGGTLPIAGMHMLDDIDIRDAANDGRTRTPVVEFAVAVNAQQFSRDGNTFAYFPPPRLS